VKSRKV